MDRGLYSFSLKCSLFVLAPLGLPACVLETLLEWQPRLCLSPSAAS